MMTSSLSLEYKRASTEASPLNSWEGNSWFICLLRPIALHLHISPKAVCHIKALKSFQVPSLPEVPLHGLDQAMYLSE